MIRSSPCPQWQADAPPDQARKTPRISETYTILWDTIRHWDRYFAFASDRFIHSMQILTFEAKRKTCAPGKFDAVHRPLSHSAHGNALRTPRRNYSLILQRVRDERVAERVGFEPTVELPPRRISSAVLSTTQPPLRVWSAQYQCAGASITGVSFLHKRKVLRCRRQTGRIANLA